MPEVTKGLPTLRCIHCGNEANATAALGKSGKVKVPVCDDCIGKEHPA